MKNQKPTKSNMVTGSPNGRKRQKQGHRILTLGLKKSHLLCREHIIRSNKKRLSEVQTVRVLTARFLSATDPTIATKPDAPSKIHSQNHQFPRRFLHRATKIHSSGLQWQLVLSQCHRTEEETTAQFRKQLTLFR